MLEGKVHEVYNFWCRAHSLSKIQPFSNTCSRNCYRERHRDTIFKMVWILLSSESLVNINQNSENLKFKKLLYFLKNIIIKMSYLIFGEVCWPYSCTTTGTRSILSSWIKQNFGRFRLSSSAGSSKIKIRTSSRHKANWALWRDEVRILIFDDPSKN